MISLLVMKVRDLRKRPKQRAGVEGDNIRSEGVKVFDREVRSGV